MIEFHGRPFLEYLIEMLRDQDFERVLVLLGYRPEPIVDHFRDGAAWDIRIEYSTTDEARLTGYRLRIAEPQLDERFLLMYCDNYWPMRMDSMWEEYVRARVPAQVTVYTNGDGYSRDNVAVGEDGEVRTYDRRRTAPGLRGVEIGYAIVTRDLLDLLPTEETQFEHAIYPMLAGRGQLHAYRTDHRYYSISTHDRLPSTDAFLGRQPAIILDRDGVLNVRPGPGRYVRSPDEFRWVAGSLEALRLLREAGYRVIVVSNQAGIGRGEMTAADLSKVHRRMLADAEEAGGRIHAIYHCPHGWADGCGCRKPKPGMLFQAQRDHHLDLTRTLFIGDDERDALAASAAGCPWRLVSEERSLLDLTREVLLEMASLS
jgi:D-glycero-D-manno-heptose 1,7-bisphosphate phosphatase